MKEIINNLYGGETNLEKINELFEDFEIDKNNITKSEIIESLKTNDPLGYMYNLCYDLVIKRASEIYGIKPKEFKIETNRNLCLYYKQVIITNWHNLVTTYLNNLTKHKIVNKATDFEELNKGDIIYVEDQDEGDTNGTIVKYVVTDIEINKEKTTLGLTRNIKEYFSEQEYNSTYIDIPRENDNIYKKENITYFSSSYWLAQKIQNKQTNNETLEDIVEKHRKEIINHLKKHINQKPTFITIEKNGNKTDYGIKLDNQGNIIICEEEGRINFIEDLTYDEIYKIANQLKS